MKIELKPIKNGEYVGIFADISMPEAENTSKSIPIFGLTAKAAVFRPIRRLYEQDKEPMVSVGVKEARRFARRLLALTRQDGDTESELEVENRELKVKLANSADTVKRLSETLAKKSGEVGNRQLKEDLSSAREYISETQQEVKRLKAKLDLANEAISDLKCTIEAKELD